MRSRAGFTLIEVLLALGLLALLAATVAVSLGGSPGGFEEARSRIAALDAQARLEARRAPQELRLDLGSGRLTRWDLRAKRAAAAARLPPAVTIERVWVPGRRDRGPQARGEVRIPISRQGTSPSYALELTCKEGARFVIFAGLGGEPIDAENLDLLALLGRHDPH